MDHKSFETHMIDFVNRNAKAEEDIRNEKAREDRETAGHLRRCKTINAAVEAIVWAVAIACIVALMSFAQWTDFIPAEIAIVVCSLFSYIAGLRIRTLTLRIKKYGGQS